MFALENVTVQFGQTVALHNVTISFPETSTTVLLGTSGSGKSTILRLLLGLIRASTGTVTYKHRDLSQFDQIALRREIGFMTQDGGLFPHLTLAENIALMPDCLKWKQRQTNGRIDELLLLTRMDPALLTNYPTQISGGQRQRAALMRALMLDPACILLDEPLGALDPITRYDLQNDLKEIFRSTNKTVILVTHDLREAAFLGERIHILDQGRVVQSGTYTEMRNAPANEFVARFFSAQRLEAKP
ncbi:MAG: ATP-binding cassette domain-containing protein [Spirochaetia bacterium]|nr:ATP-binding cassette domain-containing protein [Spirochaetia bacterium]